MVKKKESNPGPPDRAKKPSPPPAPPPREIGFVVQEYTVEKIKGRKVVNIKKFEILSSS